MKKIVKLIMELIFIFILPLLFILLSIDVKKEDVYNADNLLESETKTFEYNNQLLIDIEDPYYLNYLDFNQLLDKDLLINTTTINGITFTNNNNGTITINGTSTSLISEFRLIKYSYTHFVSDNKYAIYGLKPLIGLQYGIQGFGTTNSSNFIFTYNLNWTQSINISINSGVTINNLIIQPCVTNLTSMFGEGYEPSIEQFLNIITTTDNSQIINSDIITFGSNNIISSNYKVNYTPFGSLKKLALDQFHLNDNFIVKVLFDYTVIWFVMFLLWHLFYGLFDGLIHMLSFDRKRE